MRVTEKAAPDKRDIGSRNQARQTVWSKPVRV